MSDLFNKAKSALSGSGTTGTSGGMTSGQTNNTGEDYGDKGLDAVQKKFGHQQSRETNEKITDAGRGLYEKATGSKVNPKYSN